MIFVAEKLGNPAVALNCLKQLKLIPNQFDLANNEDMRIKLFASTFSIELSMLTRRGDLQHAMDLLPKIEEGLVRYEGKISPSRKAFIRFKMATVLFGMNEFQSAKKMFSRILNDSELDQNDDILSYAYLMELFVQLELKTDHLLTYSLKNTQRFLKSRNRFFKIEQVLLQFISRRIKCKNEADSLDLWEALHQQLSELGQQETDAWFYEYFDIKTWAESKVTQQEFQHLLKEKFNRPEIKKRKETLDQSLK
jgi:tetratricopeptide (TPR) repeat protein